jgi:hypothetical protein
MIFLEIRQVTSKTILYVLKIGTGSKNQPVLLPVSLYSEADSCNEQWGGVFA